MASKTPENQKDKKKKVRRLVDMQPFEKAWVPHGANARPFAVLKEDPSMSTKKLGKTEIEKAEAMHTALGQALQVLKTGALDDAATEAILGRLRAAGSGLLEVSGSAPDMIPVSALKTGLSSMATELEGLTLKTQPIDLVLSDKLGKLALQAAGLAKMETEPPAPLEAELPKVDPPVATMPAATPPVAAAPAASAPKTDIQAAPAVPAPVPPVVAAATPVAVAETSKIETSTPAAAAPAAPAAAPVVPAPAATPVAAAAPELTTDVVKSMVNDMGAQLTKAMTDALKPISEAVAKMQATPAVVTKGLDFSLVPSSRPMETTPRQSEEQDEVPGSLACLDLSQHPSLKTMKV